MSRTLIFAALVAAAVPATALADHDGTQHGTRFTVTVENISTAGSLRLSTGGTAPAPNSPVIWLTHTSTTPLFKAGTMDRGLGLEMLAEDGDPSKLAESCKGVKGVGTVGAVAIPAGDAMAGPALPGKHYTFSFTAKRGEKLTLATMFGQSNDWFYAPDEKGIALWDKSGRPVSGELTSKLMLWDAGTEVDEEPGVGANQGPRQKGPNTGPAERGKVRLAGGYPVPPVGQILKVTIAPDAMASK